MWLTNAMNHWYPTNLNQTGSVLFSVSNGGVGSKAKHTFVASFTRGFFSPFTNLFLIQLPFKGKLLRFSASYAKDR